MAATAIVSSAPLDAIRDSSSLSDGIGECSVSFPPIAASSTLPPADKLEERITRLEGGLVIEPYVNEEQLQEIARLIKADLSEPYSLYTYRYFIHNWPSLTFLVSLIELTWHPLFTSNTYFFLIVLIFILQFNNSTCQCIVCGRGLRSGRPDAANGGRHRVQTGAASQWNAPRVRRDARHSAGLSPARHRIGARPARSATDETGGL